MFEDTLLTSRRRIEAITEGGGGVGGRFSDRTTGVGFGSTI